MKKILLLFFFIITLSSQALSKELIKNFEISGNDRISSETIILFSGYKLNDKIDQNDINEIIKKLYETSFFKNLSINFDENILFIEVEENPLVQTVIFNGIKNKSLIEQIKDTIVQKEKSSFVENKIKIDQDRILNSLRVSGYYFSKVSSSIKKNKNNTVDIIYDIELGDKALIKNIKFIGNKVFKDNKLRKVIVSEEAKFLKFLSSKKTVDIHRFKLDEKLLKNFFKNNGYYNVNINSSFAQIIEDKYFEIVFNVDAGKNIFSII